MNDLMTLQAEDLTSVPVTDSLGNMTYKHESLADLSLYDDHCQIGKAPLEAHVPYVQHEVEFSEPRPLPGFSALFNKATGQPLPTRPVPDTYKLVPHNELFAIQNVSILESDLPLGDLEVIDRLYDGGLRAHRTVMFHGLDGRVANVRDRVVARMDIFNSVDQSWSFQVFSGAYRDLCRNTLVFGGQKAYHQKRRHTSGLSPEALVGKATMGLEFWQDNKDQMDLWQRSPMTKDAFAAVLADTICKKNTEAAKAGQGNPVNEKLMSYLLHRYIEDQRELGHTMWTAFNALTHWSTHVDATWINDDGKERKTSTKGSRKHMVQRQRETMVRDLVSSDIWTDFELGRGAA